MVLGTVGDDAYDVVLVLHILCVIVGFGAVFLNGIYGMQARLRKGPEGRAIFEANLLVSKVGEYFIYAVFVLGVALVLMGDESWDFGQTWIWLSMTIYLGAIAVSHTQLWPRMYRMGDLMRELELAGPPQAGASDPPPQVLELERLGRKVGVIVPALDLVVVVVLVLMVFKPGGP